MRTVKFVFISLLAVIVFEQLVIIAASSLFMLAVFAFYFITSLCSGFKALHWTTQWSAVIALLILVIR